MTINTTAQHKKKRVYFKCLAQTVEFLLTRAKAKRPVWKKDIPPEFEYTVFQPGRLYVMWYASK